MNFYKEVNEFLYKIDVCDMEILIDGQINMIFYNIYGKSNGFDFDKYGI